MFDALDQRRSSDEISVGKTPIRIDDQVGFLGDVPVCGEPSPELQVFIQIEEAVKYLPDDRGTGRICVENGIQDLGIPTRPLDVGHQAIGVSRGLLLVGGHPEVGLKQEQNQNDRREDEEALKHHGLRSCQTRVLGRVISRVYRLQA